MPATAREQVPDLVWSQTWQDVLVPKRDGLTQRGFCLKQDGGCLGPFFERGRSILRVENKSSVVDIVVDQKKKKKTYFIGLKKMATKK